MTGQVGQIHPKKSKSENLYFCCTNVYKTVLKNEITSLKLDATTITDQEPRGQNPVFLALLLHSPVSHSDAVSSHDLSEANACVGGFTALSQCYASL